MPDVRTERVLVVPTKLFRRLGYFQGFSGEVDRYLTELLSPEHTSYRPREEVEVDPRFKQLIPYVIFRHTDGWGRQTVFQYTRGTGQGEGRLHRKHSVGIGGHISAIDVDSEGSDNPYREGMRRELEEEVTIDTPYTARCVGMINDDQTEVGSVHLGVVYIFDVERPAVRPRETEIIQSGFRPVGEILADMTGFETWSEICMRALFEESGESR
jgi:predicted NUDIX family phosphoesterase